MKFEQAILIVMAKKINKLLKNISYNKSLQIV